MPCQPLGPDRHSYLPRHGCGGRTHIGIGLSLRHRITFQLTPAFHHRAVFPALEIQIMSAELIETMLVDADGNIPLLPRHLARLEASCAALDYPWAGAQEIERALYSALSMLATPGMHRLRLLVNRTGHRTVQTAPLPALSDVQHIMLSDEVLDADEPLLRYKTTYRPWYTDAASWLAAHPDVFDLLYLNQRGELCEGSRSNVYLLIRGVWYTPPTSSGCLPGVQRAELLDRESVHERTLSAQDLHQAEGIRLSNALRGWFDVTLRSV